MTFSLGSSDEHDFAVEFTRKDTSGEILAVTELDEISSLWTAINLPECSGKIQVSLLHIKT